MALIDRIRSSFSVARGEQQSNSDVDVMLVGNLGFADALLALHAIPTTLQREINPGGDRRYSNGEIFLVTGGRYEA